MKLMERSLFSKYRSCLMGLAAIMIMVFHLTATQDFSSIGRMGVIIELLNSGVDIFVLLSAFGCYYSMNKDPSIISFYKKRFLNVVPMSVLLILIFCVVESILGIKSLGNAFIDALRIGSDNPAWYVPFSILLYISYPMLHCLSKTPKGHLYLLTIALVFIIINLVWNHVDVNSYNLVEASLARLPIFLLGCYLAKSDKKNALFIASEVAVLV